MAERGIVFEMKVMGTRALRRSMSRMVNDIGVGQMRSILVKAGKPIMDEAKKNIRKLGNKGAERTTKGFVKKGGRYKLRNEFIRAMAFKRPQNRKITRITIGPLQKKLNMGKTVNWKGRTVPIAHWKELGTKGRYKKDVGEGQSPNYPVWRAYRDKRGIAKAKLRALILDKISESARRDAMVYFENWK